MKMNLRRRSGLLAIVIAAWLPGCVTPPIPGAQPDLLGFLEIGRTSREDVLLRLGQPSAVFEQERILTYRIGEDPKQGRYVVTPKALLSWQQVRYSLVLVFDDAGRLLKQNLVVVY
jgi:hypothetical protein